MLSIKTPAKINLLLNLQGLRPDGFHAISTVMQAVALWDELTLWPSAQAGELTFTCNIPAFQADAANNLVVQAYHLFFETLGLPTMGLRVHLEKRIPSQAGLGGGSSDAAAMLVALARLTGARVAPETLDSMVARLGSDVPFFLSGGTALATGRGEVIQPLGLELPEWPLVIIKPRGLDIATPEAYRLIREHAATHPGFYTARDAEPLLSALRGASCFEALEPHLWNDFESVLAAHYPELGEMAARLRAAGITRPMLSGSGPAMFGFLPSGPSVSERLARLFPAADYECFQTRLQSASYSFQAFC